ncbi:MAG: hypothetical protein ABJ382_01435 [Ilumatobacter sp.]
MKLRAISATLTVLVAGTVIGAATQHFASAGISSGERAVLVSITPCRLADTRPSSQVGPRSAPLGTGDVHTISARQAGVPCSGLIPADASALSLNVTSIGATRQSFLTIWPGGDRPNSSSLNPSPGQPPVPNAVSTILSVDQTFDVYNDRGSVDLVVDVNGYYVDHDHDDRYYTKSQVDGAIAESTPAAPWNVSMPISSAFWFDDSTSETWTIASGGSKAPDGLTLQNISYGRFWHGFTLPPTYRPGTDVKIRVSWMADTDNVVGCTFRLEDNGTSAYRPGVPDLQPATAFVGGPAAGGGSFPYVILTASNEGSPSSFTDNDVQVAELVVTGTDLLPGDQVQFAIARRAEPTNASQDSCAEGLTVVALSAVPA